jgi:phosphoenolpyruvate carboxykinase (GTP)
MFAMTNAAPTSNPTLLAWVEEMAKLTKPDQVVWCDGSEDEKRRLTELSVAQGVLEPLNQDKRPGCYLHHSNPNDVARVEHLTFICTPTKEEAGPTNNWMAPADAYKKLGALFDGSMKGRTMYVIPYLMGPEGSSFSKVGVEITDSRYVVLSMRIMTRVGPVALEQLGASDDFTRCLHSLGDLSPDRRFIMHFPEENTVWSIGSGYGGNALLGKKCMALRLASWLARKEGWLAEHMLILGLQDPQNKMHYVCGAFPSACGKTNLAMLVPPASMPGWKATTVGDDIAWLRPAPDGRLYAVNPEAGFFGVVPGTSRRTNPTAFDMIQHDTLFTNVALRPDGTAWWEGHDDPAPAKALDWQGRPWTPSSAEKAAHPNSRFTTPATNCATLSPEFDNPSGVPIEAILFGARRQRRVPLVYEARNWQHGTFLGATLSSEPTAAATANVGVLRRDPMAMWPFCGYNMGDYFQHWLDVGSTLTRPPHIFRVNWFRTGDDGKFLWPGFGDNLRVLEWILERCAGHGEFTDSAIGHVPTLHAIDRKGLSMTDQQMAALLKVDPAEWVEAVAGQEDLIQMFGSHFPAALRQEHDELARRIHTAITPEELEGRDSGM